MEVDGELETLLAEQRHELTVAIAAVSDYDFAIKLQMEEAIKVSLSVQPSSSSSSSSQEFDFDLLKELETLPAKQRYELPAALAAKSEHDFDLLNDDISDCGIALHFAEETERFERKRDSEQTEADMRRERDDLAPRMHNLAFTRDLLGVPEVEWNNNGNYLHKTYGEGSSSRAPAINGESFKLYCKGLVSEETVGGVKKMLAGIGVAIFDSSNEIAIYELRKPLIGAETTGEIADVRAVIEGIHAANSLGLKKISIFCDDNLLYRYITGKSVARQGKIATLVDQVTLLQRKFTHCSPTLVQKKDIKHAFELARDAIVSQVTQLAGSSGLINIMETCTICLEDRDVSQILSVNGCRHKYCLSCMKQHVEVKLLQGVLPTCPHAGCKFEVKIEDCRKFLTTEILDVMSQRIKEASVPVTQKVYCPYPRCSALMSKTEVPVINSIGAGRCTKCCGLFCINCKVPWHSNKTCSDYKRLNPYPSAEEAKLNSLARINQWRQCVKCNNMIELKDGCYHICCRCGHEFCYSCGAEWKNKEATCACPIWNERNILYDE